MFLWCLPLSFCCSVYLLISVNYRLPGGRDAVSLVHRPQICPLHHVPHHNPAPVHPKRNWHPEVHKVALIFSNDTQIRCDLPFLLLLRPVCWGPWQLPTCVWPWLLNITWWRATLSWYHQTTVRGGYHCVCAFNKIQMFIRKHWFALQDQLLGFDVQCRPNHLLWLPGSCF